MVYEVWFLIRVVASYIYYCTRIQKHTMPLCDIYIYIYIYIHISDFNKCFLIASLLWSVCPCFMHIKEGSIWFFLYQMVAHFTVRTYDVEQVFSEKIIGFNDSFDVAKCLCHIEMPDLLHMCAQGNKQLSNIITMGQQFSVAHFDVTI